MSVRLRFLRKFMVRNGRNAWNEVDGKPENVGQKGNRLREARKRQTKSETIRGKAADRLPWWGVSAAFFGVTVPKTDGMSRYALLNFSLGCLQRGQRQSSGRSSKATPSCSAGS